MTNNQAFIEPEVLDRNVKRVMIKFSGGVKPPQYAIIGPGTTTWELLRHLGLSRDYTLSAGTSNTTFGLNEVLYPLINDGDLLFASSHVDAGH
jgi:hypothetical protein